MPFRNDLFDYFRTENDLTPLEFVGTVYILEIKRIFNNTFKIDQTIIIYLFLISN